MRTGGVEPPQPRRQGYNLLSSPVLSVRKKGGRPDSNRHLRGSRPRMLPLHHGHHVGKRRGRPDSNRRPLARRARRSPQLSYAPRWRGWDSNPRSRAHEAREDSHSSTALRCGTAPRHVRLGHGGTVLERKVWLAGVEPAISCAQSRRGGHAPPQPDEWNEFGIADASGVSVAACLSGLPSERVGS